MTLKLQSKVVAGYGDGGYGDNGDGGYGDNGEELNAEERRLRSNGENLV